MRFRFLTFFFVVSAAMAQPIVIKTTTALDGKGRVLRNREITIEGGRITRIADSKQKPTIDLSGLTVMPGWIDTHVHVGRHFAKQGRDQGDPGSPETPEETALGAAASAYATLMGGFTTVQSLGQ